MIGKIFKLIFKKNPSSGQRNLILLAIVIIILLISGSRIGAIKNYIDFNKLITEGDIELKDDEVGELIEGAVGKLVPGSNESKENEEKEQINIEEKVIPEIASKTIQIISPLSNPNERIRLKGFGDYITPETSPVTPERFRGFHTGVDFEVFPEELNSAVTVMSACSGNVIDKKWVSGYGGVVVMECEIEDEVVTALYGHLKIDSVSAKVDDILEAGQEIGNLGADNSEETDKERKHLHFSLHKGKAINLRGYVGTEAALKDWLDPCEYICN